MKTETRTVTEVGQLKFGYWDIAKEQFVPVDAVDALGPSALAGAARALKCSEELLDALAIFAINISNLIGNDLRDIWKRLDEQEAITKEV